MIRNEDAELAGPLSKQRCSYCGRLRDETGGLILQYLLGYDFTVAVWVGHIALFGIAVETRGNGLLPPRGPGPTAGQRRPE